MGAVRTGEHGAIATDALQLRISEVAGRVRLGVAGLGDVEGTTLQEAGAALVEHLVAVAAALRAGCGVGRPGTGAGADLATLEFLWRLGEHEAAGGDPRELIFGTGQTGA